MEGVGVMIKLSFFVHTPYDLVAFSYCADHDLMHLTLGKVVKGPTVTAITVYLFAV